MQYQQQEYPLLTCPRQLGDGFGHMVENQEVEDEMMENNAEQIDEKDARIAQLETQLSDQNLLKQQLTEAKARLHIARTSVMIPQHFFEYIEGTDDVKTIDEAGFDNFIDTNCKATKDREKKKLELKNKLLDQVRQVERRKRGLSISSMGSISASESSNRVRQRSEEDGTEGGGVHKQIRVTQSAPQ